MTTTYTLQRLLAAKASDTWLAEMLASAAGKGLPATAWQSGSVPLTLYEIDAEALADLHRLATYVAAGGLLGPAAELADPTWIELLASDHYEQPRTAAIHAVASCTLTCSGAAGPYTIAAGAMTIATPSGLLFSNVGGGTLTTGGTLTLSWKAEVGGVAYNAASGATMTVSGGALAGVTAGTATLTTVGTDQETIAHLVKVCRAKWATLAPAAPPDAFEAWAFAAAPTVTRTLLRDDNPNGPGTVELICANASGAATDEECATIEAYVGAKLPKSLADGFSAVPADQVYVTLTGTVRVRAAYAAAAPAAMDSVLQALASSVDIGAEVGELPLDQIEAALWTVPGMRDVDLDQTQDVTIGPRAVPSIAQALKVVSVA